jgi:hypothetical protein
VDETGTWTFGFENVGEGDGTGRTWVGGKADYLGTGKAVTVAALWTNKEGGDVGWGGVPPTLEAGDVYVLSEKRCNDDAMRK